MIFFFLIERFGRFINLNITKEDGADNHHIIDFISKRAQNIEYEIFSEEILFKIPKNSEKIIDEKNIDNLSLSENEEDKAKNNLDLTKFFDDLDNNLKNLGIKSYSVSMPTLEDVFLNVVDEDSKVENQNLRQKLIEKELENDKILFETDYSNKCKFFNDLKACFFRRLILIIRDIKGFLIEILCPIFLILIGLLLSKIDMSSSSKPTELNIAEIGKQIVLYGTLDNSIALNKYYFNNIKNTTNKNINELIKGISDKEKIQSFIEAFYNLAKEKEDSIDHKVDMTAKNYKGYFGGFLMLQDSGYHFKFIEVLNTRIKHIVPIFTENFFEKLITENSLYKSQLRINYKHYPMPMTAELKKS